MGNSICISDGSTVETAMVKCKNNPCKCALSCFKCVKEEIEIADKIKELIEATIQQQITALSIKPELVNGLP